MKLEKTERNTYKVAFQHGELEVNLIPANNLLPTSRPCATKWNGKLIYAHDNVGIMALKLNHCPPVPRICWDNREHHFWRGFNGGFRPRNTIVNDIKISQQDAAASLGISFYYIVDFVKTTVSWVFQEAGNGNFLQWDTSFTFENLNSFTLEDYMAFFASYHQAGKNYYWSAKNEIAECADSFCGYSEFDFEGKKSRNNEIKKECLEIVKGWHGIKDATKEDAVYMHPVLLSGSKDWYAQGRHIIFVEPSKCLNIVSAANQARDYTLAPPERNLPPGESFTARVRHIIAKIKTIDELNSEWDRFEKDKTRQP